MEIKDYQEEISLELFYKIVELSREALLVYGEAELSEYILGIAGDYKSKTFEFTRRVIKTQLAEYMKTVEAQMEQQETEEEKDIFKKLPVN